ncbi:31677_t:CDS:1, partial [Racocetra persica]
NTKEKIIKTSDEKKSCGNKKKENVKVSLINMNISELCSTRHCDDKKNKIERDKNMTLICYQNTGNIDDDEKEMLEQKSEHVESGESFVKPKSKNENRLVFD